jgi:hypothetical protein
MGGGESDGVGWRELRRLRDAPIETGHVIAAAGSYDSVFGMG